MRSLQYRFWSKVKFTPTCWLWASYIHNGRGRFNLMGKAEFAHKLDHLGRGSYRVGPGGALPLSG